MDPFSRKRTKIKNVISFLLTTAIKKNEGSFFCVYEHFFVFFLYFCFFEHSRKTFYVKETDNIWEHAFSFFLATFFRKDIVEWNNAMSPLSNFFPNQNAPSHKKIQNMKTKENKSIKGYFKILSGGISNS